MPLPKRVESAEQTANRIQATATIEARPDYLPRYRSIEWCDAQTKNQLVRLFWNGTVFCTEERPAKFVPWTGDMQGKKFVTIG
jgi:hypothetical protein